MIDFSCAEFAFPLLDRQQSLAVIRLLGFSFVDIGLFARSSTFSPAALCASPARYTAKAKRDLARESLRAADVFLQIGMDPPICAANDPDPAVRRRNRRIFQASVDFTRALKCRHMTGLPGVYHEGAARQIDWELAVKEARWRQAICARNGIQYAVEAHLGSICDSVDSTLDFLHEVPGLTLTLDYGHFIFNGIPSEQAHRLVPHASHVHARAGARGRLQAVFSDNQIDYPGAIAALKQAEFKGSIALEYVWIDWNDCNRCDNISETILLKNHLSRLVSDATADSAGNGRSVRVNAPKHKKRAASGR